MIIELFLTKKGLHLKSEALKLDGITNEQTLTLVECQNLISRILIFKSKQNCI